MRQGGTGPSQIQWTDETAIFGHNDTDPGRDRSESIDGCFPRIRPAHDGIGPNIWFDQYRNRGP